MLGRTLIRNNKNAALYPLQADIKDRSQLLTIHFLNDSFQNLPVFLFKQINGFNEHAINSNKSISKLHNIYTFKGAFTYDVSSRGEGGGFEMLTVADKGGRGSKPC